ncbi:hypothetical protein BAE44_0006125 [Dichanthelium oligosanthes]|uniref:Uncharacterized protein n=1 Tax=Dichanthelium oligosanthes TaxID=888268 RepID=A0A1E5W6D0_9POAL|nr:hypothetical protein BAE44_0006125 [Dichanthelium oligosanthes]
MSLSSRLTMVPPRRVAAAAADPYAVVDGPPQPQTATCCTALQRGFAPDSRVQPRYAPVRTPASAALVEEEEDDDDNRQPQYAKDGGVDGENMIPTAPTKKTNVMVKRTVRKCKSTVEDVDVSRLNLNETPRLRRSGGVRRDWSFENLSAGNNAA